jgi:hypothetical protein
VKIGNNLQRTSQKTAQVSFEGFVIPPVAGLRCLPVRCTCLACIAQAGAKQALFSIVIAAYLKYASSDGIGDALNLNFLLSITLMTFYEFIIFWLQ